MSVAGFLLLVATVVVFARLDRRLWGTAATPGVMLIIGYTGVAGVYAAARVTYYFDEVQAETYVAVAFLALTCMAASALSTAALGWRPSEVFIPISDRGYGARAAVLVLVGAYLPIALVVSLQNGGLWSSEVIEPLGGGGVGHLHVALEFAVVWYAVSSRDGSKPRLPLLGVAIFSLSLYPVKGWTLIPLTAVTLASVLRASRRQYGRPPIWRYVLAWAAISTAVFFGIYMARIEDSASIDTESIGEIFTHFLFYLTTGFMGLSAVMDGLELPGGFAVLFAPLTNVYADLVGDDYVSPISAIFVGGMGIDYITFGNVYSFLGTLIAYARPLVGFAVSFALAPLLVMLGYLLFGWAWRTRSGALRAAVLYWSAAFGFGVFEYYFWHLTPYEIVLFGLFFRGLQRLHRKVVANGHRALHTPKRSTHDRTDPLGTQMGGLGLDSGSYHRCDEHHSHIETSIHGKAGPDFGRLA